MSTRACVTGVCCTAAALGHIATAAAATRLTPAEIKSTFFNGQPFGATTPSGVKFKIVFAPDGTVSREPVGKAGTKGEGTWTLDQEGFCTTWKGQKPTCFVVLSSGANQWSIMKKSALMAVWSK